jgi:AbrB family looped-hinge helix DNA binding protein
MRGLDMVSTVTSKGQITIPKEIRLFLKIKPSDKIDFAIENGQVVLRPLKTLKDLRGSIPPKGKGDISIERQQAKIAISKKFMKAME